MADMIVPSLHTLESAQASADLAHGQQQAALPVVVEAAPAANIVAAVDPVASIDLDGDEPAEPATPLKPVAPVGPAEPGKQSIPEEDELEELIIEDFTIDGICGVY